MNAFHIKKSSLVKSGVTAFTIVIATAIATPYAGEIIAGAAVAGALALMGTIESRKRAY
ncbi:hypothetical protein [Pelagicoccus albus]|uniref:Uncharacterized protein n=1 Tax=Pelagicoccus albus TaxID=415222 RepID=A0A7X1B2S9_9BACT|nr:hypothetical protein [Pelagicoccus albus]MBC2604619.1 hypothetical protein [Pelagicoccus albus]